MEARAPLSGVNSFSLLSCASRNRTHVFTPARQPSLPSEPSSPSLFCLKHGLGTESQRSLELTPSLRLSLNSRGFSSLHSQMLGSQAQASVRLFTAHSSLFVVLGTEHRGLTCLASGRTPLSCTHNPPEFSFCNRDSINCPG